MAIALDGTAMALLSTLAGGNRKLVMMVASGILVLYLGYEILRPSPLMLKHEGNAHFTVRLVCPHCPPRYAVVL